MPPATLKSFAASSRVTHNSSKNQSGEQVASDRLCADKGPSAGESRTLADLYSGLGSDIGPVKLEDGSVIPGGRLLMRDQWNSALYTPLEQVRQEGIIGKYERDDVLIHKNRMSGLWDQDTQLNLYLRHYHIKTLIFAGVNTDQCVGGSLQDAYTKGYDCLLLRDATATTTPEGCGGQTSIEYNARKVWGFVLTCQDFQAGAQQLVYS